MKKLLSLLLALTLVMGLAVTGYASSTRKITGIIASIDFNNAYSDAGDSVEPGRVYSFPLTANMFSWSDGVAGAANDPVTTAQLNAGNVNIRTSGLDSAVIKKISFDTKEFPVTGNKRTAYVKVELVEEFVSTASKDFRTNVYLAVGVNRAEPSRLILEGKLENPTRTVSASTDYVKSGDGYVIIPSAYNSSLEFDLGEGVLITTRVYADRKYYGVASDKITTADEPMLNKYPAISDIITLKTVNLNVSGNVVSLEQYDSRYHVYNASGAYLGTADKLLPYSTKYYLSRTRIDMGGGVVSSSSTGGGSSSSTGGGSSSTGGGSSSTGGGTTTTTGSAISTETARSQARSAVATARAGGQKTASVRFKDAASISAAGLKAMAAEGAGTVAVNLVADTMNGNAVTGRLTIKTGNAANLTTDTQLGVYVDSTRTASTRNLFDKYFKNKIAVVSLGQRSSYGMTVQIAVKVDVSHLNSSNLIFYSYNTSSNEYVRITNPAYSFDTNGYLHFSTSAAGDIVITDTVLARK